MSNKRDLLQNIHNINPFSNGSIFDHRGGSQYTPPPPHVDSYLLLEDSNDILLEDNSKIVLE